METQVKVYGKAQNRIALGIINAYLNLNPKSTLEDLRKAFPDALNPDCGSKKIFMLENDINDHVANGETWYTSARGYFVKEDEWLIMPDGERVGFVSMWSKTSFERLGEKAREYGIEIETSDEEAGTYRLEYLDGTNHDNEDPQKDVEKKTAIAKKAIAKPVAKKPVSAPLGSRATTDCAAPATKDVEMKTYRLQIRGNYIRVDSIELPYAIDEEIENGYRDADSWADLVGETECLYTRVQHLVEAINGEDYSWLNDDEEGTKTIANMIGNGLRTDAGCYDDEKKKNIKGNGEDHSVSDGNYYVSADEEFQIVVMDEDDEEIETIDGTSIPSIVFKDGCKYKDKLSDESEDSYQQKIDILKKNGIDGNIVQHSDIRPYRATEGWYWINIQHGEYEEYPTTCELQINGDFDASKLSIMKVLVSEAVKNLSHFAIADCFLYDGEIVGIDDEGYEGYSSATNIFVKYAKNKDGNVEPIIAYDFTNREKA